MADQEINVTLKEATLAQINEQAEKSRQLFEIYRTVQKVSKEPGELSMDFVIKDRDQEIVKGADVTLDRLYAEAARFRILQAISHHVQEHVLKAASASFSLSFSLSCSRKVLPADIGEAQ